MFFLEMHAARWHIKRLDASIRRLFNRQNKMKHTISALVENKFGVLARVAGMFSGRGFNIETLNVGPICGGKYSRITATVNDDRNSVEQCVKQLDKLVNVIDVKDYSVPGTFVERELVLVKVKADRKTRAEIVQTADLFHARVIDVDKASLIIQCTGNPNKMKAFMNMIEPFGIIDMARTGNVALSRGL
jgi:acetolactate synthase-1/3 small subunit